MKQNIAFFVGFNIICDNSKDYLVSGTHYQYLKYLSERFNVVYLICGVKLRKDEKGPNSYRVAELKNIEVVPLPEVKGLFNSLLNIKSYYKILKSVIDKVEYVYARVPDPFSWMPRLCFNKPTIMHFVGDTIDATKHNEKWNLLKKIIMILGYLPDYFLTILAARKSCVRVNGFHLAKKLKKWGVSAKPVISSTIAEKNMDDKHSQLPIEKEIIHICYVGYLRYAKGMNCLMSLCEELKNKKIAFKFHIVGNGEMYEDINCFISEKKLEDKVILYGHVDDRNKINEILRSCDLFFFPSLSEGSPRVVIEAMSQGVPVISTPVGSLPTTFVDNESIRFFNFNNSQEAAQLIDDYRHNTSKYIKQREFAYKEVKENYTIESFLSKVFTYEA
ncbi:MAG: glycosyltransferase [Bacteroidales bacterium]|nr:glycosyltransferase [Bacteroidales bacterium]